MNPVPAFATRTSNDLQSPCSQQPSQVSAVAIAFCQMRKQKNSKVKKSSPCFTAGKVLSWGANPSLFYCKDVTLAAGTDGSWSHGATETSREGRTSERGGWPGGAFHLQPVTIGSLRARASQGYLEGLLKYEKPKLSIVFVILLIYKFKRWV